MDYEHLLSQDPNNTALQLSYFNHLFSSSNFTLLESLFLKYLPNNYNIDIIYLYIKYTEYLVKSNKREIDLSAVYEYALSRFSNHYYSQDLHKNYIEYLQKNNPLKVRTAFKNALIVPHSELNTLFKDYEEYENGLNKLTAKKLVSDILPLYQHAHRQYTILSSIIDFEEHKIQNINLQILFQLTDFELKNPLNLPSTELDQRLDMFFNVMIDRFYYTDQPYFLYSEYLISKNKTDEASKIIFKGIHENKKSLFLYLYYSKITTIDVPNIYQNLIAEYSNEFNINKENQSRNFKNGSIMLNKPIYYNNNFDLIVIHYLSFVVRNNGITAFRKLFNSLKDKNLGPYTYIFAGLTEYYTTQNLEISQGIFNLALERFPDCRIVSYEYFNLLNMAGKNDSVFERITKSDILYKNVISFENKWGSNFREILERYLTSELLDCWCYGKSEKFSDSKRCASRAYTLDNYSELDSPTISYKRYKAVLESFDFLDMRIYSKDPINEIQRQIPSLPDKNNIFKIIDINEVIEILKKVEMI
ncbi:hypothetical protein CWI37_1596p0010 [Hamiltosporidium tvaerminnensis]|uniref:Suppressor of forked domain-containing protein n=1 Tax=Hamiltosporidium tvaerminnensis TaxID=1176355 RepID=A0A4Q9KVA5_9MICR|nr:hypothetical protein CWI37_1596p0010 [Hamiltosporidium tvaerminnensis]